jgi:acetyl-CoA carboxylase biotin carboxyl carrier protein
MGKKTESSTETEKYLMKPKEIQEILDFIASSGLDEVNIETEQFKLAVKRNATVVTSVVQAAPIQIPAQVSAPISTPAAAPSTASSAPTPAPAAPAANDSKLLTIKSPMIGTFYRSPGPDSDPFVSVGDTISKGSTVCIIEAMKLFNEIEAEFSGKIVKMLVENATPVEYDQPLYLVDPS